MIWPVDSFSTYLRVLERIPSGRQLNIFYPHKVIFLQGVFCHRTGVLVLQEVQFGGTEGRDCEGVCCTSLQVVTVNYQWKFHHLFVLMKAYYTKHLPGMFPTCGLTAGMLTTFWRDGWNTRFLYPPMEPSFSTGPLQKFSSLKVKYSKYQNLGLLYR